MKVLAICGSPREMKSQTRVLAEALLSGAKAKGAEVHSVDLSKARIGFCQACEVCHQGPDCVLNDDGSEQVRAIEEQKKRFGQLIALRKDQWPYEHSYWQRMGWL